MKAYFELTSGPVFDVVNRFITDLDIAANAMVEWIKAKDLPVAAFRGKAFAFKPDYTPDPKLWKKTKHGDWKPKRTTTTGRKLYDELASLPNQPGGFDLLMRMSELVPDRNIMEINKTGTPGIRKPAGAHNIRLAIDTYWLPADRTGMKEITATEYAL